MVDETTRSPELVGDSEQDAPKKGMTRGQFIGGAVGGLVVGALAGAGAAYAIDQRTENDQTPQGKNYNVIDLNNAGTGFYDLDHPCGVTEPGDQRYGIFAMFNMVDGATAQDLQVLLATWTATADTLVKGELLGPVRPAKGSGVPKDTGDTADLYPASLSVTIGFGESLFDERFGIAEHKPELLKELTRCTGDRFDASTAGSDFGVQVCADDMQVMLHALRALARAAYGKATMDYTLQGFLPTRQSDEQTTPRDLFGFRDGTTNPVTDDELDKDIWVKESDQEWMVGGTYLVFRDSTVLIEPWDNMRISEQERLIGRRKDTSAPLSDPDGDEQTPCDFDAKDEDGNYLIDPNAHVAITADSRLGFKVLRRGQNYWNGLRENGTQNAGFVNLIYANDPNHIWELRDDMGKYDILNEYYYDIKSGTYAVPQSPKKGSYIGKEFFED